MISETTTIVGYAIAALPPTLVALVGLIKSIQNGTKSDQISQKIDDRAQTIDNAIASNDLKTDVLQQKAEDIHESTNGNLSTLTAELRSANERIGSLEKIALVQTAELKAANERIATTNSQTILDRITSLERLVTSFGVKIEK